MFYNLQNQMKKLLSMFVVAGFATAIISCGPSAEEKAAVEKVRQDSINRAMEIMAADSMANVEKSRQDSISAAAMEKMKADSMAAAQAAAKKPAAVKPKPKPKPVENKMDPTPKVGAKKPGGK